MKSIEEIWIKQRTGYGYKLSELSPLQDECLTIWQDAIEQIEEMKKEQFEQTLLAVIGVKRQI